MLIFVGAMAAIIATVIKFRMKRIPMSDLRTGILVILPVGILFASVFGKLGTSAEFNWRLWEYFYFWEPGMNLFGGLIGGTATGFAYYWRQRNKRLISIWTYADCIVPNLFIAQSIGRWGNLFNHEILGKEVSASSLQWLPNWIWERCFYFYDPSTGTQMDHVVFHEPLFLYESIVTFVLFILISFIIPNLGRWFSKKPWRFNKTAYPCTYNRELQWAVESEVDFFPVQDSIKFRYNKDGKVSYTLNAVWKKAYYYRDVNGTESSAAQEIINSWKEKWQRYVASKKAINKKFKQDRARLQMRFKNNKIKFNENLIELKIKHKESLRDLSRPSKNEFVHWWKTDSSKLYKLHNDNNYFIVHAGFVTSMYLILYTVARIILEFRRNPFEFSIKSSPVLDSLMYCVILIIGITMFVFAQFVAPKKWREEKWLYEKSY
jgi:phosphatidylglycerol:prolipoprotein diacylglycerol transferase